MAQYVMSMLRVSKIVPPKFVRGGDVVEYVGIVPPPDLIEVNARAQGMARARRRIVEQRWLLKEQPLVDQQPAIRRVDRLLNAIQFRQ